MAVNETTSFIDQDTTAGFLKSTMTFIKPVYDEKAEFGTIGDKSQPLLNKRYGDNFDHLLVGLFYQKDKLSDIDGVKHHLCQLVIVRNKLELTEDAREILTEQPVYRGYFDVPSIADNMDNLTTEQRRAIKKAIAVPVAALWHGYVDDLELTCRNFKVFQEVRGSIGCHLLMEAEMGTYSKDRCSFYEGGLQFDSAELPDEKCEFGVDVVCQRVTNPDDYREGYTQDVVFTAKHSAFSCKLSLQKAGKFPYINVAALYAENEQLIKNALRIK